MNSKAQPSKIAAEIRAVLKRRGSAEHAKGVQWFFKEDVQSRGWYAKDLRALAREYREAILKERDIEFLVRVADRLFAGRVLEEKIVGVLLLENLTNRLERRHLFLLESWVDRVSSWAEHDALVHYLIAPMLLAYPTEVRKVFTWAKSADRWHRRAACVALIQGTRQEEFFAQIVRLSNLLLRDEDDMVQKGLGWLLRETAKRAPERTISYLLKVRSRAPRLVLRTACETLSPAQKQMVLAKQIQ